MTRYKYASFCSYFLCCLFLLSAASSETTLRVQELQNELGDIFGSDIGEKLIIAQRKKDDLKCFSGEIVLIIFQDKEQREYRAVLTHEGEKIHSVPITMRGNWRFALMGLSGMLAEGIYHVFLEQVHSKKQINYTNTAGASKFYLVQRKYRNESIQLSKGQNMLRESSKSPRAREQAEDLWSITGDFSRSDFLFHSNFSIPLHSFRHISGFYSDIRSYYDETGRISGTVIHGGVDIVARDNSPVISSAMGKVVYVGNRVITGNTVVVSHFPGVYSLYYHLDGTSVEVGDLVLPKTQLGIIGNTGFSTGAHVHWEVRVHNVRVDPLILLNGLDKIMLISVD